MQNYKQMSVEQKKEVSDLLYNNKKPETSNVVIAENSDQQNLVPVLSVPSENSGNSLAPSSILPVIKLQFEINMPKITVNPVINLCTSDLIVQNNSLQIPPIDVQLTINIT